MFVLCLTAVLCLSLNASAQCKKDGCAEKHGTEKCGSCTPETIQYAIKGTDTLLLDFYRPKNVEGKAPVMIFAFGGGFFTGKRDSDNYKEYFKYLTHNGWAVASIDYRLGLAEISKTPKDQLTAMFMLKGLITSVDMAVEDMYSATNYIIENAEKLNVNPDEIVVCGSSAGAITSCQAEWNICRNHESAKVLPEGFNYAGVVSFAGAILSTDGTPKWDKKPCPMMFFHGSSDSNVPYNKLKIMKFGFLGSKYICGQLEDMKAPYWFFDVANYDHTYCEVPMNQHREEISIFLNDFVIGKENRQIHEQVNDMDKPEGKTKFSAKDYIMANMPTK